MKRINISKNNYYHPRYKRGRASAIIAGFCMMLFITSCGSNYNSNFYENNKEDLNASKDELINYKDSLFKIVKVKQTDNSILITNKNIIDYPFLKSTSNLLKSTDILYVEIRDKSIFFKRIKDRNFNWTEEQYIFTIEATYKPSDTTYLIYEYIEKSWYYVKYEKGFD